jgi:hypothetical protein
LLPDLEPNDLVLSLLTGRTGLVLSVRWNRWNQQRCLVLWSDGAVMEAKSEWLDRVLTVRRVPEAP